MLDNSLTERVLKAVSSATAIIAKSIAPITASNTKPTSFGLASSVALPTAPIPLSSYDTQQSCTTTVRMRKRDCDGALEVQHDKALYKFTLPYFTSL